MREPDELGAGTWKAWRSRAVDARSYPAHLELWLLYCPGAHLAWAYHALGLVTLRDTPGLPPAVKSRPDATHEFMCMALHPDHEPDPDDPPWEFLQPPNWIHQIAGGTDDVARRIAHMVVQQIMTGRTSPDTDFANYWMASIDATVEHFRSGKHGVA